MAAILSRPQCFNKHYKWIDVLQCLLKWKAGRLDDADYKLNET